MTRKEVALKYKEVLDVYGEIFIPYLGTFTVEDLENDTVIDDSILENNGGEQ